MARAKQRRSNKVLLTTMTPKLVAIATKAIVNRLGNTTVIAPIEELMAPMDSSGIFLKISSCNLGEIIPVKKASNVLKTRIIQKF